MKHVLHTTLGGLIACLSACGGYLDVPIQQREQADLVVEYAALSPGAIGRVQVAAPAPEDVTGPLWLMSPPIAVAPLANVSVVGYHLGPCEPEASPVDDTLRVCVAVFCPAGQDPSGMQIALVADNRETLRRWTYAAEVSGQ